MYHIYSIIFRHVLMYRRKIHSISYFEGSWSICSRSNIFILDMLKVIYQSIMFTNETGNKPRLVGLFIRYPSIQFSSSVSWLIMIMISSSSNVSSSSLSAWQSYNARHLLFLTCKTGNKWEIIKKIQIDFYLHYMKKGWVSYIERNCDNYLSRWWWWTLVMGMSSRLIG